MATTRRNHLTTDFIRSPFISERRRKLFPTEDLDLDSDLGHISPIGSDDNISDNESQTKIAKGSETHMRHRADSETMSPLILSPCGLIRQTPLKFSPSQILKTPHDTSTKPVLEKEQKTLLEESKSLKRKLSPDNSPVHAKSMKSDLKSSKVRTALFPPNDSLDMGISTKSFYSKKQENAPQKISNGKHIYKPIKFTTKPALKLRRQLGQINKGVRHKIRKRRQKKLSRTVIAKATKKMLETGSALNEYIIALTELKNKQFGNQKMMIETCENRPKPIEDPEMINYLNEVKQRTQNLNKKLISSPPNRQKLAEENKENVDTKSWPSSSDSPEDKDRKFFKKSRSKVIIKQPDEAEQPRKFTFPQEEPEKPTAPLLDSSHDFEEDDVEPEANIDDILGALSDESPQKNSSLGQLQSSQVIFEDHHNITLEAHRSIVASENSIQLHQPNVANMILSPISHMCDVTSGLALNSPVRGRDLTALLSGISSRTSKMLSFNGDCHSVDMNEQKKLFPVFCKGAASGVNPSQDTPGRGEKRERTDVFKRGIKRFKGLPSDQMLLDAGQKKFGLTLCNECNIFYHMGDPNDEIQHMNYHNAHQVLRFAGWKNEHLVADFQAKGRIIRVLPTDSKIWLKKVNELMEVVKRDLGCYEIDYNISQSQVYMYIKNRTIVGCAVATVPKEPGHKMLSSLSGIAMCSEESYPIKCGISHIWVAENSRKQGIASAMLDAVKKNFIYGTILSDNDIALTSPTEAGSAFAEKYFKTPNYLIYYT